MLNNDYHSFPESVIAFEKNGQVIQIIGGDGIKRSKLTIPGWYRGKTVYLNLSKSQTEILIIDYLVLLNEKE